RAPAFQAGHAGSIPVIRSKRTLILMKSERPIFCVRDYDLAGENRSCVSALNFALPSIMFFLFSIVLGFNWLTENKILM
ncbi:hypothetical protein, partial [uncultured Arcanobacterium sp.]|uniref:hypothetical protein n=1 Tax=uncultured Arcanobacterium sp. TaxID=487520 RepID=UPI00262FAE9E